MWRQRLFVFIIFLLPWQARLFLLPAGDSLPYTSVSIYALDCLMLIAVLWSWRTVYAWMRACSASRRSHLLAALVGFVIAMNIASAPDVMAASWKVVTLLLFFLFALVLVREGDGKQLRFALVISAVVQSLFAVAQFLTQTIVSSTFLGIAEQVATSSGVSVIETVSGRFLRAYGSFPHPNILAGFLSLSLIATIDWYFAAYEEFQQWWNAHGSGNKQLYREPVVQKMAVVASLLLGAMTIILSGLYLSFSRAAVLAIVAALLVYGGNKYLQNPVRLVALGFKLGLVALLTLGAWTMLVPNLWTSRITSSSRLDTLSNVTRIAEYQEGISLFSSHPLVGVGLQNEVPALMLANPGLPLLSYQPVHNIFFLIIIEVGILGVFVLGLAFAYYKKKVRLMLSNGSASFVAAMTCLIVLGSLDHYLWSLHAGLILWLIPVLLYSPLKRRVQS
ncbi:MAG: O-antigen ligase family protein [Patescibacteria group bacterium]|jgi:hypothetical protein